MKTNELFAILKTLNINYQLHTHEAIFTSQDAKKIALEIPGAYCKNLFLQDTKKNFYLLVLLTEKKIHLKALAAHMQTGRLSFTSPDTLQEILGVSPGSVTPFALINDTLCKTNVILDQEMLNQQQINLHPLVNTMTLTITPDCLLKFIKYCGHPVFHSC